MFSRLIARLRRLFGLAGPRQPPLADRVAQLESRVQELADSETERELRWTELNVQLRRYLGRLDAHAGHEQRRQLENGHVRGGARPDVLAAKYPHGVPGREG